MICAPSLADTCSAGNLVRDVDQVNLDLLAAVLGGGLDDASDGGFAGNAQHGGDVRAIGIERGGFIRTCVHGLQVN